MDWTDEYREIVEFYYWEPQHIGRANGTKRFKGADDMYLHVNNLEVSLNHILNLFSSLYDILSLDCFHLNEKFEMISAARLEKYQREQGNATQPDMFFESHNHNIALELKLQSKTSLNQVIKYINFNQSIQDYEKKFSLYFLAPYASTSKLFTEKYAGEEDVINALREQGISNIPDLHFLTYNDLYDSLKRQAPNNVTEKKLISGLVKYLEHRHDLNITPQH